MGGLGAAEESGLLGEGGVLLVGEEYVVNVNVDVDVLVSIEVAHGRSSSCCGVMLSLCQIVAVDLSCWSRLLVNADTKVAGAICALRVHCILSATSRLILRDSITVCDPVGQAWPCILVTSAITVSTTTMCAPGSV